MSSIEEEPSQEAGGRSTGVSHKMASHQNVHEDYTYGYREAEEVSKAYKEESSFHKKPDGHVYGYKEPEEVIKGFEEEPHSHHYEKPEDVYGYKEPEEVRFSYKPKDSIIANVWGRLKSYKCPRPSLLRVIAIVTPVVALLAAGACVLLYLNKHGETADPPVKESPQDRLLESRMVSQALSKMTPAQARLATTLPDNTTGLPQMADTQPDQSTSLPGVISTDTTDISSNHAHGETAGPSVKGSPKDRLLESRMVPPAMSEMAPAQAWLATTLPDNTTGLPQMTDTQPDQSTSLPGVISTDITDISSNKETALLTAEGDWTYLSRPPPVRANSSGDSIHVPRCIKGYRLLAGTCIKLFTTRRGSEIGVSHVRATKACKKEGATLAMPKTEELDAALRGLVKRKGGNYQHWIGMEEKGGSWFWVDGSKVGNNGYQGWNPGEPSNSRWPPLCGQYWEKMKSSGWLFRWTGYVMWDDDACLHPRSFICQRPPA
ncbi:hypothetical protein Bbelb_220330 [Branchiostoma belcheri]|nr:hypothetical protein Bbelb_220330 [Branchiostoma belcheri]